MLVADIRNCRVIEIAPDKHLTRQWGQTGACVDNPPATYAEPNGGTPLPDGGILITEIHGPRVVRLDAAGNVVFSIHVPAAYPSDAQLDPQGNVVVSDYANPGAVIALDPTGASCGAMARAQVRAVSEGWRLGHLIPASHSLGGRSGAAGPGARDRPFATGPAGTGAAILRTVEMSPRCPSCEHEEWVRGNVVVVPGAHAPVRVSTSYLNGPSSWTCANCGYADPCGGEIERLLDRAPALVARRSVVAVGLGEGRVSPRDAAPVPRRDSGLPDGPHAEPRRVGEDDRLVRAGGGAVGGLPEADRLLRIPRRAPSLGELSIHDLIVRIRWERAKHAALEPGSRAYLAVGESEARLIRELHHRFGVENIAASDLEWYVRVDRDRRPHRVSTESA